MGYTIWRVCLCRYATIEQRKLLHNLLINTGLLAKGDDPNNPPVFNRNLAGSDNESEGSESEGSENNNNNNNKIIIKYVQNKKRDVLYLHIGQVT